MFLYHPHETRSTVTLQDRNGKRRGSFCKEVVLLMLVREWRDDFAIHRDICHLAFSSPCLSSPPLSMLRRQSSTDFLDGSLTPKSQVSPDRSPWPLLSLILELMPSAVLECDKRQ